jgi:hypothetical protein
MVPWFIGAGAPADRAGARFDSMESGFLSGRIFCGKPVSTPASPGQAFFPENAPAA